MISRRLDELASFPSLRKLELRECPLAADSLEPRWIDYESGLLTRRGCGDAVLLPVPPDANMPRRACGIGVTVRGWLEGLGDR